jgi:hypothetical protein
MADVFQGDGQFQIPEACYPKFEAAIAKLSRKSEKLGGGEISPIVFGYEMIPGKQAGVEIKVFNVLLGGEVPTIDGWEFVAKIDHANKDLGNIIRALPGKTVPERFRQGECNCEHCNINRFRRDTFVLYNASTDEHKQVGRTCLKDFLGGHDNAEAIAKMAELLSYAREVARGFVGSEQGYDRRYLNLEEFLTHVAAAARIKGYFVSKSMAAEKPGMIPTATVALDALLGSQYGLIEILDEDQLQSVKAIEWAQNLEGELNEYQHNIKLMAASGAIEFRSATYAASIIGGYLRTINEPHVKTERPVSNYVGTPGQAIDLVVTLKYITETNGRFPGYMYIFNDSNGNAIKWFTTMDIKREVGDIMKMNCKVKTHDEYKGVKGTIVSHAKLK